MKMFKSICKKTQMELKKYLFGMLKRKYKEVIDADGFLYAKGTIPVLVTAHMDTVHKAQCSIIKTVSLENGTKALWSPQGIGGDDRCGIWMIARLLNNTKLRPYVLFCEDEEVGGVGSNKFVATEYIDDLEKCKYLIELDRAHANDAVFYSCGNKEFQEYITQTTGLKKDFGSFSDISHLSPACDRASVNISCGYYNAHTVQEYVVFPEMQANYEKMLKLIEDIDNVDVFDYQRETYFSRYGYGGQYNMFDYGYYGKSKIEDEDDYIYDLKDYYEITYLDDEGEQVESIEAKSYEEAIGMFCMLYPDKTYNDIKEVVVF